MRSYRTFEVHATLDISTIVDITHLGCESMKNATVVACVSELCSGREYANPSCARKSLNYYNGTNKQGTMRVPPPITAVYESILVITENGLQSLTALAIMPPPADIHLNSFNERRGETTLLQ
ncbi:hypothetical protein NDU88_002147 [Pleurodeles waltl]|uniref:Uncharacterized protein n=1 Tax=Pleurodeles waltl TaxID=8319 RepID=A0AAV7R9A2_PLEWA|nr:hypothetical protein NDU88_002147 [Pleurodeles waltl]